MKLYQYLLLMAFMVGCGEATEKNADAEVAASGGLTKRQVQFFLQEDLKLTAVVVTPGENGAFTATGKKSKADYEVELTPEANGMSYSWKNSKGKKGSGSFSK